MIHICDFFSLTRTCDEGSPAVVALWMGHKPKQLGTTEIWHTSLCYDGWKNTVWPLSYVSVVFYLTKSVFKRQKLFSELPCNLHNQYMQLTAHFKLFGCCLITRYVQVCMSHRVFSITEFLQNVQAWVCVSTFVRVTPLDTLKENFPAVFLVTKLDPFHGKLGHLQLQNQVF